MTFLLKEQVKQNTHSIAELREMLYELIKFSTDSDKQFKTRMDEWEAQRQKDHQKWEAQQEKWEAQQAQDKIVRDRERRELNQQMGRLAHKLGLMIESLVVPDLPRHLRTLLNLAEDVPIIVNSHVIRLEPAGNGTRRQVEIDAIAECDTHVMFVEAKNSMRAEYVSQFLERLQTVRPYFPEYDNRPIIGAIASMQIAPEVRTYAMRQGLIILSIGEGFMDMDYNPEFAWKSF